MRCYYDIGQRLLLLILLTLFPAYGAAANQSVSQDTNPTRPLLTPVNPALVNLKGTIVEFGAADENEWRLQTVQGMITVNAGPRWHRTIDLAIGEEIIVQGELGEEALDAFAITRADESVIRVRPYFGPPPWADQPQNNTETEPPQRVNQRAIP